MLGKGKKWRPLLRSALLLSGLMLWAWMPAAAQVEEEKKEPPSEGFADTMRRMQIKRAEAEHKKLVKSAKQAAEIAEQLPGEITENHLKSSAEKKLREIEKAAKQIRNYVGSANDEKDFEPPKSLNEAVDRIVKTSQTLSEQMDKTSRHLVSAAIIVSSSDMLRLVKILRTYLN